MFVDQIPGQEQWEYPHWRQVTQPPSCSSFAPHSGQKCIRPAMSTVPRGFGAGGANSFQCPSSTCRFQSVIGTGRISLITDLEEKRRLLRLILSHYTDAHLCQFDEASIRQTAVFQLRAEQMTCKERTL